MRLLKQINYNEKRLLKLLIVAFCTPAVERTKSPFSRCRQPFGVIRDETPGFYAESCAQEFSLCCRGCFRTLPAGGFWRALFPVTHCLAPGSRAAYHVKFFDCTPRPPKGNACNSYFESTIGTWASAGKQPSSPILMKHVLPILILLIYER